ncbi:RNA-binding protein 33 [Diretmus argenteus]
MAANAPDDNFDEYDKPGAERSRRRRGEDDDLDSDLEEDLLEEDWLSGKKNPSEASDEELNDDLLQSDDEDAQNTSGQDVSFNATFSLGRSFDHQENVQEADYADDIVNLGTESYEEGDVEGGVYQQGGEGEYTEEYSQGNDTQVPEDQMDYSGQPAQGDEGYQDEVLDIQINEPIDSEFQDEEYSTYAVPLDEHGVQQEETHEDEAEPRGEEQQQQQEEEEDTAGGSRVFDSEEVENEAEPKEERKEESDEEDDDDEESGRLRFKSERKDVSVVRLADAGSKRRNIPETLELSEQAKADLMEFEERERQKRLVRFGGRGRGGGGGRGRGRGGFPGFGMTSSYRGNGRGRMNDHRLPLMANMGMQQPSSRMLPPPHPHQQQLQSQQQQHHHAPGARGPPPFQEHGGPLAQQPLQPLIPPHMAHRSPPVRPPMETPPPRMMGSPPPNFPQHHQQQQPPQPQQPKNIHINPHFRGPASSPAQVPLMPPAQSQPRPAVGPQRFPGPGDFQQHMPGNFGQPQRPPHHMEPFRSQQPPPAPQDREPLFMEPRFPGQHMFDHQSPSPLMNSSNSLHQQQQLPSQGHMGFGQPGPAFSQSGQGPLGLFQREPPRPNPPPHQGHQGMVSMNQQGAPTNQPRTFMGPRQPFGQQQGNPFPPPQLQFGMQVRMRGLIHGPPLSQLPHHEPLPSHQPMHQQQQHHRQDLSQHHQQHQHQLNLEHRPMMHHGQNPFHQHGSARQMTPRPQNPQQRSMSNRPRMSPPASKQLQMQLLPQRNSNLRELPVAPGNTNMNNARPAAGPAPNFRPVAKATQGVRPGQNVHPMAGRGRGQAVAKAQSQPWGAGRTVVRKEIQSTQSNTVPQDPDEDEETRQYRLKIEQQKRLREEILKRKEMRRQMQAGVRKRELMERINAQANPHSQGAPPSQNPPSQQQQQQTLQPLQQQQQPPPPLQQRQFVHRPQQQQQMHPNQGNPFPPNGTPQTAAPRPNVKTRLQMMKGGGQQQQIPEPGQHQQKTTAQQNLNRPGPAFQTAQATQRNMPMQGAPSAGPGQAQAKAQAQVQAQAQGLKLGVKRTVMQRAKNAGVDGPPVPQKVRVVKLSAAGGKGPEAGGGLVQQPGPRTTPLLNQGTQRKVTMPTSMTGQQLHGPGAIPQASRGDVGTPQHNRVVVPGRGRGGAGPGTAPMGRGRVVSTRQNLRSAESKACTVSIEGLSSSTTDIQLQNLLSSIGPIQMFQMLPQQRKAVARFSNPQHAASFQVSFHRHMIDLSHIDVNLIDG